MSTSSKDKEEDEPLVKKENGQETQTKSSAQTGTAGNNSDQQKTPSDKKPSEKSNTNTTNESERDRWSNGVQFILTCVGYSVGLGNIWRFPALAYENGGGAFLIPYITCSMLFGLPLLYFEFCLGQYLQGGPSVVFYKFMPAMQGIGWAMALVSVSVGIYYNVIIAWVGIYLFKIVTGESSKWVRCGNDWNTIYCQSKLEDEKCQQQNETLLYFFNNTCHDVKPFMASNMTSRSPAEEFFENYVLYKSDTMDELGGINSKVMISLSVMWVLIGLGLWKGVKYIGKISLFTATTPYLIIGILFVRGVTLDGASIGIDYYMLDPDFSIIFKYKTWKAALTQVCFSLSIGFGGLLSMASYNQHNHNCLKDAIIVAVADSFMSIFGGIAVFSTLGFLSKEQGVPLPEVVQSGTSLAFVAYPEAMGRMPVAWLWSFLFFFMLFLLGVSTQFVYTETMATSLLDQFPHLKKYRLLIILITCVFMFSCGLVMVTRSGIFWFNIFNDFTGSFSVCVVCVLEVVVVMYIYGSQDFLADLRSMFGSPKTCWGRFIGRSGCYFKYNWIIVSPLLGTVVMIFTMIRDPLTYGKGDRLYTYPDWSETVGWLIGAAPAMLIPIFFAINIWVFSRKGDWREAFRVQPSHRSYSRKRGDLNTCRELPEADQIIASNSSERAENSMQYVAGRHSSSSTSTTAVKQTA